MIHAPLSIRRYVEYLQAHLTQVAPMRKVWRAASPPMNHTFPPGAGYAGASWKKDFWGDIVSPSPSLHKVTYKLPDHPHHLSLKELISFFTFDHIA
jgi:hypothetical protein